MAGEELDDLDRALVALLQEDARMTNRALAARVGSSEATVRRRVERLLDAGLIRIVAVASPFALGYRAVAILGAQIDRAYQRQIEQALHAMPEVRRRLYLSPRSWRRATSSATYSGESNEDARNHLNM